MWNKKKVHTCFWWLLENENLEDPLHSFYSKLSLVQLNMDF